MSLVGIELCVDTYSPMCCLVLGLDMDCSGTTLMACWKLIVVVGRIG